MLKETTKKLLEASRLNRWDKHGNLRDRGIRTMIANTLRQDRVYFTREEVFNRVTLGCKPRKV